MNKPNELAAIPHPPGEQPETVVKRLSKGRCPLAAYVMDIRVILKHMQKNSYGSN